MPEILETQCPHCKKSMKLKSRKALGKQAPCPKCKKPFLVKEVPSAPADDDFEEAFDDVDDFDDDDADDGYGDDDGYDEPRRRPASSGRRSGGRKRPRKRKGQGAKWVRPTMLIGGGVVGVAMLGLGIWFVWGMFNKGLDLAYLPPDARSITISHPAAAWKHNIALGRYTSDEASSILEKEREMWGVNARDIKSITTASNNTGESIRVIRSSANLDPEKILGNVDNEEKVEHAGKEYYRIGGLAIYFPDSRTAITGSEDSIKKVIDRGPKPRKREKLDFVNASYDNVVVQIRESQDRREPEVIVTAGNYGTSSTKGVMKMKFPLESTAIDAVELGEKKLNDEKEEWENSKRDKYRESLRKRGTFAGRDRSYKEDEIEDELNCKGREINSQTISRSGSIVTITTTNYVSRYEKRMREERRTNYTVKPASAAKAFGRSMFRLMGR